jgi:hypothetical protein
MTLNNARNRAFFPTTPFAFLSLKNLGSPPHLKEGVTQPGVLGNSRTSGHKAKPTTVPGCLEEPQLAAFATSNFLGESQVTKTTRAFDVEREYLLRGLFPAARAANVPGKEHWE